VKRVSLSKAAAADIEAIDDYTIEHFGVDQAIRTSERFRETLELLGEMPRSGQLREEISPPGREFRYRTVLGSFVVSTRQRTTGFASPAFSTAHEIWSSS
jgi:plasmid stabilization system protein ParE